MNSRRPVNSDVMRLQVMSTILHWLGYIAALIGVLVVVGIPVWIWQSWAKKKRIENVFAGRQPLDERTFYETYFESRGIPFFVVNKVRQILEEELGADLSRLSAQDDFAHNLSFFWNYESAAAVEIVVRLENEFNIKITDAEAERTTTIDDLINLVWGKVRERAHNKSLDASGVSGLLIHNLSVAQSSAAASTQPFGGYVLLAKDWKRL